MKNYYKPQEWHLKTNSFVPPPSYVSVSWRWQTSALQMSNFKASTFKAFFVLCALQKWETEEMCPVSKQEVLPCSAAAAIVLHWWQQQSGTGIDADFQQDLSGNWHQCWCHFSGRGGVARGAAVGALHQGLLQLNMAALPCLMSGLGLMREITTQEDTRKICLCRKKRWG